MKIFNCTVHLLDGEDKVRTANDTPSDYEAAAGQNISLVPRIRDSNTSGRSRRIRSPINHCCECTC